MVGNGGTVGYWEENRQGSDSGAPDTFRRGVRFHSRRGSTSSDCNRNASEHDGETVKPPLYPFKAAHSEQHTAGHFERRYLIHLLLATAQSVKNSTPDLLPCASWTSRAYTEQMQLTNRTRSRLGELLRCWCLTEPAQVTKTEDRRFSTPPRCFPSRPF